MDSITDLYEVTVVMTSLTEVEETEDIIPIRTIELTNEKPKLVVGRASANKNRNLRAAPDNALVFNGVMSRNHATIEFDAENQVCSNIHIHDPVLC